MSGAQTSTFANTLYNPLLAQTQTSNENALLLQQQDIGGHELEMGARLAGTLLSSYDTPEARAVAYPTLLAQARAVAPGYFKNAPAVYPGDEPTRALARLGTPSQTQQEWGFNLAANKAYTAATATPTTPAATTTGGSTTAPAGDGLTGDKAHDLPLIVQRESGGDPTALNYVARQDPTAYARGATASGKYQIVNSTWREGMQLAGLDPAQYATAREAPEQVQDKVASAIYDKYGNKPWQTGPQDWVKDEQGRYQMATVRPAAGAPGGAPAIAPPGTLPGAPATPPPYRVASNAPVPPPASTAPAVALPRDQAVVQAQRTGQAVPVAGVDGLWALPNGNLSSTPPSTAPAVPQAQVVPQPPANRVMPGAADGPPAVTAQAPPQPAAAPASTPQPPQLAPLNAAGLTPIQQRQIDAYAADPRVPLEKRMAAQQAFANQNIQLAQKAFSDYVQLQQLEVSRGNLTNAQAETNLKYWQAQHPELAPNARPETLAIRTLQELAPAVRAGTATQDQIDRYNNAATVYQDFKTITDPISKQIVQVPSRPLPPGYPPPAGTAGGGAARPLTEGLSSSQQQVERDPAAYKVSESQYTRDSGEIGAIGDAGRQAQADQIRNKEMQDVLQRFTSGPGTEARTAAAAWLQRWLPASVTGWERESANLSGADAAQAFMKLGLTSAGTQERSVLGARGGFQAIKLFREANPNVNLQSATNKSILDMQLVSNQANQDYSQAALEHFANNETRFSQTHQYDSLAQFDRTWNSQRNPQVYAAAMGAISGQSANQWAKGLSADEYQRAQEIVQRAKPEAVIHLRGEPPSGASRPPLTSFQR